MPSLHMEVEANRGLVQQIRKTVHSIEEEFSGLSNQVNSSIGITWISPSATEFGSSFNQCSMSVRYVLEELESLATRLQNEIAEWEQIQSSY